MNRSALSARIPQSVINGARLLRNAKEAIIHRMLDAEAIRKRGLRRELGFWNDWLATKGSTWPEDFIERTAPMSEISDPLVAEALRDLGVEEPRILDVGAGPLSALGNTFEGKRVDLTAVDPLGTEYAALLAEHNVSPRVATQACSAEALLQNFVPESFDITYARNSLDHSLNAPLAILNMVELTKPSGFVLLRHHPSEGQERGFQDLHQWNFEIRGQALLLSDQRGTTELHSLLGHRGSLDYWIDQSDEVDDWLLIRLKKNP